MENKRNKNYIEIENKFFDALIDLVFEKGYRDISVNDIIERSGVKSKKTFYLHFKDKEDMFTKLQEQSFDDIIQKFEASSNPYLYFTNKENFYTTISNNIKKNLSYWNCFAHSPFAIDFVQYLADRIAEYYKKMYTTGIWEKCCAPVELFRFYHTLIIGVSIEYMNSIKSGKSLDFKKIEQISITYRKFADAYSLEYYSKLAKNNKPFVLPDIYTDYMISIYPESKSIWEGHILKTNIEHK